MVLGHRPWRPRGVAPLAFAVGGVVVLPELLVVVDMPLLRVTQCRRRRLPVCEESTVVKGTRGGFVDQTMKTHTCFASSGVMMLLLLILAPVLETVDQAPLPVMMPNNLPLCIRRSKARCVDRSESSKC